MVEAPVVVFKAFALRTRLFGIIDDFRLVMRSAMVGGKINREGTVFEKGDSLPESVNLCLAQTLRECKLGIVPNN